MRRPGATVGCSTAGYLAALPLSRTPTLRHACGGVLLGAMSSATDQIGQTVVIDDERRPTDLLHRASLRSGSALRARRAARSWVWWSAQLVPRGPLLTAQPARQRHRLKH